MPTAKAIEKNPTNVLKVYRQILQYYKAYEEKKTPGNTEFHQRKRQKKKKMHSQKRGPLKTDQTRRLKETAEKMPEKKESDEKVAMKTPKTIPENKGIWLFTLLPVKSSFTMSNILIDTTAVQDLILGDKKRKIGEAHAGLFKTVRTLIKVDPMSVLKPFFDIERFETRTKKFVHFCTNGVSVSVLLGEESEPKSRARKPKRKREEEDELLALSLPSYETRVGLDPGLHYLF